MYQSRCVWFTDGSNNIVLLSIVSQVIDDVVGKSTSVVWYGSRFFGISILRVEQVRSGRMCTLRRILYYFIIVVSHFTNILYVRLGSR